MSIGPIVTPARDNNSTVTFAASSGCGGGGGSSGGGYGGDEWATGWLAENWGQNGGPIGSMSVRLCCSPNPDKPTNSSAFERPKRWERELQKWLPIESCVLLNKRWQILVVFLCPMCELCCVYLCDEGPQVNR